MDPFRVISPEGIRVPIVISSPHSGTNIPEDIKGKFNQEEISKLDDTDWFIDKLYDFAPAMGITMINAAYSRWLIDLNRNPESKPLYDDGRIITDLCPTKNFEGDPIYNEGQQPDEKEVERRLSTYYWPYYKKIQALLDDLKAEFGHVLLWDAHSIRQCVPTISEDIFPDLILGDNHESTARIDLTNKSLSVFATSSLAVNHNLPFKGGHITRYFGKPDEKQHALQLEMTKINYMTNDEVKYDEDRAEIMRELLTRNFEGLIEILNSK